MIPFKGRYPAIRRRPRIWLLIAALVLHWGVAAIAQRDPGVTRLLRLAQSVSELSKDEERALVSRLSDESAAGPAAWELVRHHMPLTVSLVRSFVPYRFLPHIEDVHQEVIKSLFEAVLRSYDPAKENRFSTFVRVWVTRKFVRGAVNRVIRALHGEHSPGLAAASPSGYVFLDDPGEGNAHKELRSDEPSADERIEHDEGRDRDRRLLSRLLQILTEEERLAVSATHLRQDQREVGLSELASLLSRHVGRRVTPARAGQILQVARAKMWYAARNTSATAEGSTQALPTKGELAATLAGKKQYVLVRLHARSARQHGRRGP